MSDVIAAPDGGFAYLPGGYRAVLEWRGALQGHGSRAAPAQHAPLAEGLAFAAALPVRRGPAAGVVGGMRAPIARGTVAG